MKELATVAHPGPSVQPSKRGISTSTLSGQQVADSEQRDKHVQELQNLRTVEISGLPKKAAAAQFWLIFTPQGVEEVKMITGDAALSQAADQLKRHTYPQTFPDPGPVKIVRRGVLSCSQFTPNCQLVMLQPQWTRM
jgi:hypothetical protein